MPSPARLMEAVSSVTGIPLVTVIDIDRKLAKAALRAKTGRGLNVARMTPLDAACLLTAILASPQANASAEAVGRYARTCVDEARSSDKRFGAIGLADLAALPADHGFVDGLAALIASAGSGSLARMLAEAGEGSTPHIEVFAFTRATRGRIRLTGLPSRRTASLEYIPIANTVAPAEAVGDLEQSRRITERTILAVAELLAKES